MRARENNYFERGSASNFFEKFFHERIKSASRTENAEIRGQSALSRKCPCGEIAPKPQYIVFDKKINRNIL